MSAPAHSRAPAEMRQSQDKVMRRLLDDPSLPHRLPNASFQFFERERAPAIKTHCPWSGNFMRIRHAIADPQSAALRLRHAKLSLHQSDNHHVAVACVAGTQEQHSV